VCRSPKDTLRKTTRANGLRQAPRTVVRHLRGQPKYETDSRSSHINRAFQIERIQNLLARDTLETAPKQLSFEGRRTCSSITRRQFPQFLRCGKFGRDSPLAVNFAHHNVKRSDDCGDVSDQAAFTKFFSD